MHKSNLYTVELYFSDGTPIKNLENTWIEQTLAEVIVKKAVCELKNKPQYDQQQIRKIILEE